MSSTLRCKSRAQRTVCTLPGRSHATQCSTPSCLKAILHPRGSVCERQGDDVTRHESCSAYIHCRMQQSRIALDGLLGCIMVHACRSTEANKYSAAELALMRTQDIGYLRTKAQTEAKVCSRRTYCG